MEQKNSVAETQTMVKHAYKAGEDHEGARIPVPLRLLDFF